MLFRSGEVELVAAETLDPAAFPTIDAFTGAVRKARKSLKLPRRCCAVVWGLPDGSGRKDPTIKPLLAPLRGAGFRIQRAISPCNALAALARLKMPRGDGATCWLAINRTGVAMVVVRPGKQIYSHSFAWNSNVGAVGSQARLLQRYSLVAHLAPEIRRAMAVTHEKGTQIDSIVTCGNLPEIRSLTMPLIEELDVEVETLDSLEGLIVKPAAVDRLSEVAAALRIACAGAIARQTRKQDESKRPTGESRPMLRYGAAAAVLAGVLAIGWGWWRTHTPSVPPATKNASPRVTPPVTKTPPPSAQQKPAQMSAPPSQPANAVAKPPQSNPPAVSATAKPPQSNQPAVSTTAKPPQSNPSAVSATTKPPQSNTAAGSAATKPPQSNPPAGSAATKPPQSNPPSVSATSKPPQSNPHPTATLPKPSQSNAPALGAAAKPPQSNPRTLDSSTRPADKSGAGHVQPAPKASDARKQADSQPMPELLKDPVPRVTAILISSDRRMATVDDGRIIGVGDTVGARQVVAIDDRAVVLREPSGVRIRVALGGRVVGVIRSER